MLTDGSKAPKIELLDQNGKKFALASLGKKTVLVYFYPKADTPGCTTQSCGLPRKLGTTPKKEKKSGINWVTSRISAPGLDPRTTFFLERKIRDLWSILPEAWLSQETYFFCKVHQRAMDPPKLCFRYSPCIRSRVFPLTWY